MRQRSFVARLWVVHHIRTKCHRFDSSPVFRFCGKSPFRLAENFCFWPLGDPRIVGISATPFLHVHSHGAGEAFFSAQDDAADQTAGDGVYVAVVLGRCIDAAQVTVTQRLVVWRGLLPLRLL